MLILAATTVTCGKKSPTSPTPTPTPTPSTPATAFVSGSVFDGTSNQPIAGATIQIEGLGQATSAADGSFGLSTSEPQALRATAVTSATTVDRATWARVPGAALALPLMPSLLNLTAFDQMFRGNGGALHRWTTAPRVVVQSRVLRFTNISDTAYTATDMLMSGAEADALLADLTWALPQLTGSTFAGFADPQIDTAVEGQRVTVSRPGLVVVARYEGLSSALTFWGYTRWAWNAAGETQSGIIMLDRGFETSGSVFRRSLRAHELGHALGYNHVTVRPSAMDSAARTEPTQTDRDSARIAFLRPVLNRSPDSDPSPATSTTSVSGPLTWSGAP